MASADKELEAQLLESGNKLVEPPSDVDELLPLLDRVENCLSKVEQSPAGSMQAALSPSLQALVDDKLLRHSDTDVKVAVASCISEITRITAPEAPYDDDQMREVFKLIVSSFDGLDDNTSRSYSKRTSILETVAKVRSCVVMLDLECDALIVEMFQHFLKAIRDHHPENVFTSMETIMTLVLEESEDISVELLTPLLASVKNHDEEVLPVSRRLSEKVLESCVAKVKPYLIQAVKSLNIALDHYSNVVATICQDADDDGVVQDEVQASDENMAGESKVAKPSLDMDKEDQEDKAVATEGASIENVDPSIDGSPQSAVSNGVAQTGGDDSLADSSSLKRQDDHLIENSKNMDASSRVDPDSMNTVKAIDIEEKPEQSIDETGKKDSLLAKSTAPSDSPRADNEKVKEELPNQEGQNDDSPSSHGEGPSADAAIPSENDKGSDVKPSSLKELEIESANAASVSASGDLPVEVPSEKPSSGNLPDEVPSKKSEPQEMDSSNKEPTPSADDISKKVCDVTSDSEARPSRRAGKKVSIVSSSENKATTEVEVSTKVIETASDSEKKPLKQSAKKVDGGSKTQGSSPKQAVDKKKPARAKTVPEKDVKKASAKDNSKDAIASPKSSGKSTKDEDKLEETPKTTNSKRKRTPGKEKESGSKDFGHSMVGSKIKVWWPFDQVYYDGTIESFDSARKKHKVLYTDGDVETLNLQKERWEYIGGGSGSDKEQETGQSGPDASNEMPLKKKTKTKPDVRTKQKKIIESSPKKVGGASSSKSKTTTPKSARSGKSDGKSKDDSTTKSVGKSEDAVGGKSKDNTPKSGGSKIVFKTSGKSKNTDSLTPKSTKSKNETTTLSTKSKQATPKSVKSKPSTPKAATASKDKPHLSSAKSSANGTGKAKSPSSAKMKESESTKEDSADSEKLQELAKVKLPNLAKGQRSDTKSGKKRRRGVKG